MKKSGSAWGEVWSGKQGTPLSKFPIRFLVYIVLILGIQFPWSILSSQSFCNNKYNEIWILGGRDNDTILNEYGGCEIDFSTNPVTLRFHQKPINAPFQNASICSKYGNLLCYSNGCEVINGQDQLVVNGDSLNPGEIFDINCPDIGYNGFQNMFILPSPGDTNMFYIFHINKVFNYDSNASFVIRSERLYYSKLDVTAHNGRGELLEKNLVVVSDTGLLGSPMSAVRHANGIDWWIITPDRWSNGFYTTKLDSTGPKHIGVQYIGDFTNPGATGGQGKFSPDGSRLAWYHPLNGLFLYNFDRASGLLSNFQHIDLPNVDFITGGCEFSPSGRFLYLNQDTSLFQLDMRSEDIQGSLLKIADYDGFKDPLPTTFFIMERTPDDRILLNSLNGSQWLHIIQEPEKEGIGCNFEQHGIKLPTVNNFTLPHFPNYKLGKSGDPLCDSVVASILPLPDLYELKIFPNPASDVVTVENWKDGNTLYVLDVLGNTIAMSKDSLINVSHLGPGFYILLVRNTFNNIGTCKLVVSQK